MQNVFEAAGVIGKRYRYRGRSKALNESTDEGYCLFDYRTRGCLYTQYCMDSTTRLERGGLVFVQLKYRFKMSNFLGFISWFGIFMFCSDVDQDQKYPTNKYLTGMFALE